MGTKLQSDHHGQVLADNGGLLYIAKKFFLNVRDVGMACQKVSKQVRDDACKQRSTYWQSPIPTSFSHYS